MGRVAESQRKLLEQLMGAEAMGLVQTDLDMWDPKVCKAFIVGECPYDLFTNTRTHIGSCPRTHSLKLKREFAHRWSTAEAAGDTATMQELNALRADFERIVRNFVENCDDRIRASQKRLEKTPLENSRFNDIMQEMSEIESAHAAALAEVERLGSEGHVEESMKQLEMAEALQKERDAKEKELLAIADTSGASGHQRLRVCDVCSASLSLTDTDKRLADHFGGKMHLGYLQLRNLLEEWRARGPLKISPRAVKDDESAPAPSARPSGRDPLPVGRDLGPRGGGSAGDTYLPYGGASSTSTGRSYRDDRGGRDDHRASYRPYDRPYEDRRRRVD